MCGQAPCPQQVRDLWAKAHLVVARWDELMQHPTDPHLRAKTAERMEDLRAAVRIAESVMHTEATAVVS